MAEKESKQKIAEERIKVEMSKGDRSLIESALNAYWNEAVAFLGRKDLRDLEKQMYLEQRDRAKKLMMEIDLTWW